MKVCSLTFIHFQKRPSAVPYFIYRVKPFFQFEKLCEFDDFKLASTHAKALRLAPAPDPVGKIKLMFAQSEQQAEDLLSQVRTSAPLGDD